MSTPSTRCSRKKLEWHAWLCPFSHAYHFMIVNSICLPLKSPRNPCPSIFTFLSLIKPQSSLTCTIAIPSFSLQASPLSTQYRKSYSPHVLKSKSGYMTPYFHISINPVTLKRTTQFPWPFSPKASLCKYFYTPISEKALAPHSSALAWEIPWTEDPGGLQSMGSHRVRHDWSDLAAAAAAAYTTTYTPQQTEWFFFLQCLK